MLPGKIYANVWFRENDWGVNFDTDCPLRVRNRVKAIKAVMDTMTFQSGKEAREKYLELDRIMPKEPNA